MGWGSGSRVFNQVIDSIELCVSGYHTKVALYAALIDVFEDADCDTLDECVGESEAFDEAYYAKYPKDDDEEE